MSPNEITRLDKLHASQNADAKLVHFLARGLENYPAAASINPGSATKNVWIKSLKVKPNTGDNHDALYAQLSPLNAKLQWCYDAHQKAHDRGWKKWIARFKLQPDGQIEDVRTRFKELKNVPLEQCFLDQVEGLKLNPSPSEDPSELTVYLPYLIGSPPKD